MITLACLALVGCARPNPYADFYHLNPAVPAYLDPKIYEASPEQATIYSYSDDRAKDDRAMMENGFVLLGYSSFNGGARAASQSAIQAQAKIVGASVVLTTSQFTNSVSGSIPYTVQNPSQMVVTNTTGTANAYGSGGWASGSYQGTSTTWIPGGTATNYIPYTIQRYDFFASYWIKRQFHFGAYTADLTPELRARIQRNQGVVVTLIVKGTPAYYANLLVGDIIVRLNGHDVSDARSFNDMVTGYEGQSVALDLVRGSGTQTLNIQLTK
ncbi:MAG: PDZ domain-containing protein [Acidobacteria bacterium]|nr:PDZ domain-containing protein [Acidobacteriota bacterium]